MLLFLTEHVAHTELEDHDKMRYYFIALLLWLVWLPGKEADLAGYRLYFRAVEGQQYECVWEGEETLVRVAAEDGDFIVRAFDFAGIEA